MIKEIVKDQFLLSQKSLPATIDDLSVVKDLEDTFMAHHENCLGMAANMIGVLKRIIIVKDEHQNNLIMINPVMMEQKGKVYYADEGCLSLNGTKNVKRFDKIKVSYQDIKMKKKIKTFTGLTAQVIQHEMDHCEGVLV